MISPQTIQTILDVARIEEVVGDVVRLRKSGTSLTGLCPFHNEKTPSFHVSPVKGIFKCFGCGKGGDSVRFVMEHENASYPEALRYLAQRYNIEIEEIRSNNAEQEAERLRLDSLFLANEYAAKYYAEQLFETDMGKSVGLSYFKQRGFSEATIRKFGLGYAPDAYDGFTRHATTVGYSLETLKAAALTRPEGRDFFRNRILFPIHTASGKVVGFGGRIMGSDKNAPKYLNTSETEIYNKSRLLYGIFFAKKAIRQLDECILTEGYTDVVSLHQAGIENVVSSSGTSLTVDQIGLIKRHTENIKILYDGDAAGIKAALRGLDLVLEQGLNVKIVLLPDGEDPDSYVQRVGTTAFRAFIDTQAQDFILFKTRLLLDETKHDPIQKVRVLRDLVQSIAKIPDPLARSVYIKECSVLMQMGEDILTAEVNKLTLQAIGKAHANSIPTPTPPPAPNEAKPTEPFPDPSTPPTAPAATEGETFQERDLVRLLITFGDQMMSDGCTVAQFVLVSMDTLVEEITTPRYRRVVEEYLAAIETHAALPIVHWSGHPDETTRNLAISFLAADLEQQYSPNWVARWEKPLMTQPVLEENFEREARHNILYFKFRKVIRLTKQNQDDIAAAATNGTTHEDLILKLYAQQKLATLRTQLAAQLGIVGAIK